MMLRAQMPLVRGRSHSEKLTFSALLVNKCKTKKERQTKQKKEHRNIAPLSLQLRSYNNIANKLPEKLRKNRPVCRIIETETETDLN